MIKEFEKYGRDKVIEMFNKSAKDLKEQLKSPRKLVIEREANRFSEKWDKPFEDYSKDELKELRKDLQRVFLRGRCFHSPESVESLTLFILEHPEWFIDEIESETESTVEIMKRVCTKYFEAKKAEGNKNG